jgi:hypothetical protein
LSGWRFRLAQAGVMSAPKNITVSRDYNPAPDACVRTLDTLLKSSVNKKAAEPAPEPDGRKDGTKAKGDSARAFILPETP